MRKIIFTNRKGGVGKTTSAVNVSAALAEKGKRVLLLDLDSQAHATLSLGLLRPEVTILSVLRNPGNHWRFPEVRPRLFLVPGSERLSEFEVEAVKEPKKLLNLRRFLASKEDEFDFVVIDSPPNVGVMTLSGLLASEEVIVPLPPHFLALKGLAETKNLVDRVKKRNPSLRLAWVLPTFFNPQLKHARAVIEEVKRVFGPEVLLPPVHTSVRLAEAPSFGQTIFEYAPKSRVAQDYLAVAEKILGGEPK